MRTLIDTCVVIDWMMNDEALEDGVWEIIDDPENRIYISVETVRELVVNFNSKKLLNKRTFWGVGIGALILGIADLTVPLFWDGYDQVSLALRAVGVAAVSGTVLFALIHRVLKQRKKELATASAAPAPGPKALSRKEILAIADSAKTRD